MSDPSQTGPQDPNAGSVTATQEKQLEEAGFTKTQINQLSQIFNSAITSHSKRGPDADTIAEKLIAKLTAAPKPEPTETEVLRANLKKVTDELSNFQKSQKDERLNFNKKSALAEMTTNLSGKVDSGAMQMAINILSPNLIVSEEGAAINFNGESLPIAEGCARFLQTKEAEYLRPVQAQLPSSTPNQFARAPQFSTPGANKQAPTREQRESAALSFLSSLSNKG